MHVQPLSHSTYANLRQPTASAVADSSSHIARGPSVRQWPLVSASVNYEATHAFTWHARPALLACSPARPCIHKPTPVHMALPMSALALDCTWVVPPEHHSHKHERSRTRMPRALRLLHWTVLSDLSPLAPTAPRHCRPLAGAFQPPTLHRFYTADAGNAALAQPIGSEPRLRRPALTASPPRLPPVVCAPA